MKNIFLVVLSFFSVLVYSQENFAISGTITDANNGETVYGASVYLEGTTYGVTTNTYGFYSLTAPAGTYNVVISYIGYEMVSKEINLTQDMKLSFEITEESMALDEVVVTAEETEATDIRTPQMSVATLKTETIKKIPVVLGEVDIIKSIQLLPGVSNGGEGSGGFNVRGGAADQNLVLLDEAIIYNTSHLFGFFSVFNADAIKDLELYKGSIPAQFGGRVSSVLDVRQKDGNNKNFDVTGGIGVVSSRLALEGPIAKDKSSFLLAGRGSYAHLFLKLADEPNSAYFYDVNGKVNYQINDRNKLYLSGYYGRDVLKIDGIFENNYGNISANLRWNHVFNDKLFSNTSLIYSKYDFQVIIDFNELDWVAAIDNYNFKYDLKYYASQNLKLNAGVSSIYYKFNPGEVKPTSETSPINYLKLDQKKALETGIYVSAEHKITDKLTALYGLRYSFFNRLGGQYLNNYANGLPVVYNEDLGVYEEGEVISETYYDDGDVIESYGNFEPRVGLSYQLNDDSSIKLGYSRTAQYLHLLSNTSAVTPVDVWSPSGKFIKPQLSDQFSAGYFKNINNNKYSLEVETFYKTVDNRIDYVDGSVLIGTNTIETEILTGESRAYGLEVLLKKNKGNLTGWIAYTLSKSEQRTPGGAAGGLGINDGEWYNTSYDRTHDISVTGSYSLNKKWSLGANLIFQTGRPVTYPNGQYEYEGISIANYAGRNENRLPAYHRIDVSATYTPNKKPDARWKGEWVFSIYNLYNRYNAASITFSQNQATGANEAIRTSIFGIVPSVTYNFNF
ncbi:collagen-binding protein [Neptunitalea chrysea]|uniref:Collagen-binding protein n=1 Tax=Neptunitalea chrysea TaxID=1647581 RepID=A0A9W6EVT6_9FLAO|nr:TonB-dependent receptor [Neptunitalea chrysea]GLB52912.1 collagen-binding protein [Neptunitalea chrysea]